VFFVKHGRKKEALHLLGFTLSRIALGQLREHVGVFKPGPADKYTAMVKFGKGKVLGKSPAQNRLFSSGYAVETLKRWSALLIWDKKVVAPTTAGRSHESSF
jgi:hypothetical protein